MLLAQMSEPGHQGTVLASKAIEQVQPAIVREVQHAVVAEVVLLASGWLIRLRSALTPAERQNRCRACELHLRPPQAQGAPFRLYLYQLHGRWHANLESSFAAYPVAMDGVHFLSFPRRSGAPPLVVAPTRPNQSSVSPSWRGALEKLLVHSSTLRPNFEPRRHYYIGRKIHQVYCTL